MFRKPFIAIVFCCVVATATLSLATAQPLHSTSLPGGSGSIDLPDGWTIAPGPTDMVSASGPQGLVDLGIYAQMYTPAMADRLSRAMFGHRPPAVGPYDDPMQALIDLYVAMGIAQANSIKVKEHSRDPHWTQPGENVLFVDTVKHQECVANVLTGWTGEGQFMLYQSRVCAPQATFKKNLPVLLRIWSSWHISDHVYQQRLEQTAMSLNTVSGIITGAAKRAGIAGQNEAQIWDKIIKGCTLPYYKPNSPWCETPRDGAR
jgi:hypothetical protein